jgi:hypothetical protein
LVVASCERKSNYGSPSMSQRAVIAQETRRLCRTRAVTINFDQSPHFKCGFFRTGILNYLYSSKRMLFSFSKDQPRRTTPPLVWRIASFSGNITVKPQTSQRKHDLTHLPTKNSRLAPSPPTLSPLSTSALPPPSSPPNPP